MSNRGAGKRGHGRLAAWIVAIAVIAVFAIRFTLVSARKTIESIESIQAREGKPVEVIAASEGEFLVWTPLAGTVEGISQYPVISTNSIQVMDVLRREGDRVKKGDVLIKLEKEAVNPMLHSYERSRAVYEDALKDAERMRNLYAEGAVSKQSMEKAEMALKIAESDLRNARGGVDLKAAFPGIVTRLLVEKGEMANSGQPLAWIARTDSVKIVFKAGSRQAMAISRGQKAVWKNGDSGDSGEGIVSRMDLSADPETRLVSGEAVFHNPDGKLIPGILVSFSVLTMERKGVLKIPVGCIMETSRGRGLFVVSGGGDSGTKANFRIVETGTMTADEAEIVSGLEPGERVVRFGQKLLADGDLVKVMERRGED